MLLERRSAPSGDAIKPTWQPVVKEPWCKFAPRSAQQNQRLGRCKFAAEGFRHGLPGQPAQKSTLTPSWSWRALLAVPSTLPKFTLLMLAVGAPKKGVLKALNASARNSTVHGSRTGKRRKTERSKFLHQSARNG